MWRLCSRQGGVLESPGRKGSVRAGRRSVRTGASGFPLNNPRRFSPRFSRAWRQTRHSSGSFLVDDLGACRDLCSRGPADIASRVEGTRGPEVQHLSGDPHLSAVVRLWARTRRHRCCLAPLDDGVEPVGPGQEWIRARPGTIGSGNLSNLFLEGSVESLFAPGRVPGWDLQLHPEAFRERHSPSQGRRFSDLAC